MIEYIKRAYETCNDESEKKVMESELRKLISERKPEMNQIDWKREPLPAIFRNEPKKSVPARKEKIPVSNYKETFDIEEFDNKPSKAKMKAQKIA